MPPNFVHSLDSTHMMMTALHCHRYGLGDGSGGLMGAIIVYGFCQSRAGIPFIAVHDSFWTHACFVDEMNKVRPSWFLSAICSTYNLEQICREQFVALHKLPVMESLAQHFDAKFRQLP